MPDTDSPALQILLYISVGLLAAIALLCWRISRRLARLERRLGTGAAHADADAAAPTTAETSAGGAFETFLSEDPARRALPKGEQFAAYRKWRQEKGLNWSGS